MSQSGSFKIRLPSFHSVSLKGLLRLTRNDGEGDFNLKVNITPDYSSKRSKDRTRALMKTAVHLGLADCT